MSDSIPSYYEFQNRAKVLSGTHAIEHVPWELTNMLVTKPMLVTGADLVALGLTDALLAALDDQGYAPVVFDEVPVDSSFETVADAAKRYRESGCDGIIALGGGSVIDTAKGINLVITHGLEDMHALQGNETLVGHRMVPFVAIPTTAGTGSEVTGAAVIKDTLRHVKVGFNSYNLVPDVAVLDPRMTAGLPPRITASTGMDALTHAVEAYSCLQANPLSDAHAVLAVELISGNLVEACRNGRNIEARMALANAALMAGAAFSNAMVGIVHATGHAIGGVAGVAHGDAMAIILPHAMRFNVAAAGYRYARLLLPLTNPDTFASTPPASRAEAAIGAVEALLAELTKVAGQPTTLSQVGVTREQFAAIAERAINDGAMAFNPAPVTRGDVISILEEAF